MIRVIDAIELLSHDDENSSLLYYINRSKGGTMNIPLAMQYDKKAPIALCM